MQSKKNENEIIKQKRAIMKYPKNKQKKERL